MQTRFSPSALAAVAKAVFEVSVVTIPGPDSLVVESATATARTHPNVPSEKSDNKSSRGENSESDSYIEIRIVPRVLSCSDHGARR